MQGMILSGGRWPERKEMSHEAERQLRLRLHNACLIARSFLAAGFTVALDDIIVGERIDHLLGDLKGLDFHLVNLIPSHEAVRERELERGTTAFKEWEWLTDEVMQSPRRMGLRLDTTRQTPEETVDEILNRRSEALVFAKDR
jgi:chloramphenicol 3-O-phosphotransferase